MGSIEGQSVEMSKMVSLSPGMSHLAGHGGGGGVRIGSGVGGRLLHHPLQQLGRGLRGEKDGYVSRLFP